MLTLKKQLRHMNPHNCVYNIVLLNVLTLRYVINGDWGEDLKEKNGDLRKKSIYTNGESRYTDLER